MRTIPSGFLDTEVTDLQVCWMVVRRDGIVIRGTEYDADIEISGAGDLDGVYLTHTGISGSDIRSTADMSVDNLEVTGALQELEPLDTGETGSVQLTDLSAADIEAGMFDNADVVTFLVNSTNPNLYQHILRTGWMGSVTRTAEGEYRTEMRGLTQALSQSVVRTYSVGCDAELGDDRCKVDMTAFTHTRTVTQVFSRRLFQVSTPLISMFGNVPGGTVEFTSGANTGYRMEIKSYSSLQVGLYLPMPLDIEVGDDVTIRQGCDKAWMTCVNSYNNIVNFRGHGVLVPGDMEILKVGKK
jgi:uncharacterized phage protein (TIGR02218 family)